MSDRIYVGTRKGLFSVVRGPRGWNVEKLHFLAQPVTMFLNDARDGWTSSRRLPLRALLGSSAPAGGSKSL